MLNQGPGVVEEVEQTETETTTAPEEKPQVEEGSEDVPRVEGSPSPSEKEGQEETGATGQGTDGHKFDWRQLGFKTEEDFYKSYREIVARATQLSQRIAEIEKGEQPPQAEKPEPKEDPTVRLNQVMEKIYSGDPVQFHEGMREYIESFVPEIGMARQTNFQGQVLGIVADARDRFPDFKEYEGEMAEIIKEYSTNGGKNLKALFEFEDPMGELFERAQTRKYKKDLEAKTTKAKAAGEAVKGDVQKLKEAAPQNLAPVQQKNTTEQPGANGQVYVKQFSFSNWVDEKEGVK